VTENDTEMFDSSPAVSYPDYSDDGVHIIDGTESVSTPTGNTDVLTWHSNLSLSGSATGTKLTSEPGVFVVAFSVDSATATGTGPGDLTSGSTTK
jgi:hypothetical protein